MDRSEAKRTIIHRVVVHCCRRVPNLSSSSYVLLCSDNASPFNFEYLGEEGAMAALVQCDNKENLEWNHFGGQGQVIVNRRRINHLVKTVMKRPVLTPVRKPGSRGISRAS